METDVFCFLKVRSVEPNTIIEYDNGGRDNVAFKEGSEYGALKV